ncbi:MAG: hypothetical protein HYZ90_07375, partial [Candidatus Omnitrophica bacterium]|nr:hypothetical protein [Candidatus Omnitrophota bacterium]
IEPLLEAAHVELAAPIVKLFDKGITIPLGQAIVDLQAVAWRKTPQWEPFVVETLDDLDGLGKFLGIDDISRRSWKEKVSRALATQA